jgi:putative flippase GtrA
MLANLNKKIMNSTAYKKFTAVLSFCFHFLHKKFLWGVFKKIDEKFFKFLFVGFLNTAFSYFIYVLLIAIGLIANMALFFQYIIGVLWNFKTTGTIVFQNKNNKLIFKFILSYIFTFLVNSVLLAILTRHLNAYLAQAILIMPIAMLSFIILKKWVFKQES